VDPEIRTAILAVGLGFCAIFTYMTFAVAFDSGFDVFTLAALLIVGLIFVGLVGAIRNPPNDR
jgi:hypothetical protein